RDISRRRRAQREQALLAGIVNASDDAIVSVSDELKITSWNPAAERLHGFTAEEALGSGLECFVGPDELDALMVSCRQVLATGISISSELRARRKDGRSFTVLANLFPSRDAAGKINGIGGIGRDISALKEIEKDLRGSQEYTRALIECSIDAMVAVGRDLRITDVNEQFATLTQIPKKVLIGSRFDRYFDNPTLATEAIEKTLLDGCVSNFDLVMRRASGSEVLVSFNTSLFYSDGRAIGIFGVARDVGEERAIKKKLQEERAYSRSLVEASANALLVCDINLGLTDLNESAVHLTHFSRADLLGADLASLFTDPARVREVIRQVLAHEIPENVELMLLTKDAGQIPVSFTAAVCRDEDQSVRGILASVRDISERQRQEKERLLLASVVESSD
ncbi:MAG: PAS domain-containing protein, partial [Candidatus Binataceae bacterium]|nr:PAS domain-containing protein [Candidatus Binataceae bacterium]